MKMADQNSMILAMNLSQELGLMTQVYSNRLAKILRQYDVTYPQYVILNHIVFSAQGPQTISQISDAVEVLQPAVTKSVKKFTQMGLVETTGEKRDRRIKKVEATDKGAAFIGRLQAALVPDVINCFSDWSPDQTTSLTSQLKSFRNWLESNSSF